MNIQRLFCLSYRTIGSPELSLAQRPFAIVEPCHGVLPLVGPNCGVPFLSQMAYIVLAHCTTCVAPTERLLSEGAPVIVKPAKVVPTPSKPTPGVTVAAVDAGCDCRT